MTNSPELLDSITHAADLDGTRRFARWNAAAFTKACRGPARALWEATQRDPEATPVFTTYLQLLQEGVGQDYFRDTGTNSHSDSPYLVHERTFLEVCFLSLLPRLLPRVPPLERLPLLVKTWNLGEGLLQEPLWMDRYVASRSKELEDLRELESFLIRVLEPVLQAPIRTTWSGPFQQMELDTRGQHEDFLPGEMHWAAPTVLCVHDRRHANLHLGVFLAARQRSSFLGIMPCFGEYHHHHGLPHILLEGNFLYINQHKVELRLFHSEHRRLVGASGFVVVSGVDSQRLWIVESA